MELNEKAILKQQYIAFFIALILFLPSLFLSATLLGVAKFGILPSLAIMCYVGASSIKNRISIIRPKGRMTHSTGKEAATYGVIVFVGGVANTIFVLSPLSDVLFPF